MFEKNDKKGKIRSKCKGRHPNPRDICNYCKEPGHWKVDCPKKKSKVPVAAMAQDDYSSELDIAFTTSDVQYPTVTP